MKQLFAFLVFVLSCHSASSQVDRTLIRVGFHSALPVGDAAEVLSLSVGLDLMYHFGVSELLDLGVATGFTNAFVKNDRTLIGEISTTSGFENIQHVPLAGSVRLYPVDDFKVGGDFGYALGIDAGNKGGLYYRPMVGVEIGGSTELNLSYTAIAADDSNISTAVLALLFLF